VADYEYKPDERATRFHDGTDWTEEGKAYREKLSVTPLHDRFLYGDWARPWYVRAWRWLTRWAR